jgi:class 3 adenylate cyclase
MSMFRAKGRRTKKLVSFLKKREKHPAAKRGELDCKTFPKLFRKSAVVFTDTADFTIRTARDGILHFLMVFDRAAAEAKKVITRTKGELVKVEGDSLLIRYGDADAACRAVLEMDDALQRLNHGRPDNEQVHFSYGIGYGDVLDIEADVFGLEVNLASKLGEDLAEPGEALLTPAAAAALSPTLLKRVAEYRVITFGNQAIPVQRLKLRGSVRRGTVRRGSLGAS